MGPVGFWNVFRRRGRRLGRQEAVVGCEVRAQPLSEEMSAGGHASAHSSALGRSSSL